MRGALLGWLMVAAGAIRRVTAQPTMSLPTPRRLGSVPEVQDAGHIGASGAAVPSTATLAVEDLRQFQSQLDGVFPLSAEYYPADSLQRLRVTRAAAWLARLGVSTTTDAFPRRSPLRGHPGRYRLAVAEVAFRAQQDRLAQRELDARLAELTGAPVEQSLTLAAAVALFTEPEQDEARLVRNFSVANTYATRLIALPASGYPLRSDSLDVRRRKFDALAALFRVVGELPPSAIPFTRLLSCLAMVATLPYEQRFGLVRMEFPYTAVAMGLLQNSQGRTTLDTLTERLLRVSARRDSEWTPGVSATQRAAARAQEEGKIRESFAAAALIGHPAPPIRVHAWINTPDSLYTPVPRAHGLDDGMIRVIAFGGRTDVTTVLLDRIQRAFPSGMQVVLVTETEGHIGPDVLAPDAEVDQLRRYYEETRHFRLPIAIWAGAKVSQEPPRSVPYQRYLPIPSPAAAAYQLLTRHGECVIVDGHGMIRGYQVVRTRTQEAALVRLIASMRAQ